MQCVLYISTNGIYHSHVVSVLYDDFKKKVLINNYLVLCICMLHSHIIHMQLYGYTCRNILNTITTSDTVLRKIYLSLYLKGLCVRGIVDRTELQHINLPSSSWHSSVSFSFSRVAQPEAQLFAWCCFLYSIISPTLLIPKLIEFPVHWVI